MQPTLIAGANTADQLRSALQMKIGHLGILPASVRLVSCIRLLCGASAPLRALGQRAVAATRSGAMHSATCS